MAQNEKLSKKPGKRQTAFPGFTLFSINGIRERNYSFITVIHNSHS